MNIKENCENELFLFLKKITKDTKNKHRYEKNI